MAASTVLSLAMAACGASGDARSEPPSGGAREERADAPNTDEPTAGALARLGLVNGTPEKVTQACVRAARRSTLETACPPITPEDERHSIQYAGRLGGSTGPRDSYSIHLSSGSLRQATDRTQPGHWAVEAAADPAKLRTGIVREDRVEDCRIRRRKGLNTPKGPCAPVKHSITVAGTPVTEYRMPAFPNGGIHGGHLVFMWQGRDAAYLVSVHDPANRARGLAITGGLIGSTT
jgi:hypothetical protein